MGCVEKRLSLGRYSLRTKATEFFYCVGGITKGWTTGVRFPVGTRDYFLHSFQTGSGVHPTVYLLGTKAFSRVRTAAALSWPLDVENGGARCLLRGSSLWCGAKGQRYLHIRISEVLLAVKILCYDILWSSWIPSCGGKYRNNFTVTLYCRHFSGQVSHVHEFEFSNLVHFCTEDTDSQLLQPVDACAIETRRMSGNSSFFFSTASSHLEFLNYGPYRHLVGAWIAQSV
jgi:hypothetical protein